MKKQSGFTAIEVIMVIVVAAMIGAGAYLYMTKDHSTASAPQADTTASTYQTNSDLDQATQQLDTTNVDSSLDAPLQQLDQQASAF